MPVALFACLFVGLASSSRIDLRDFSSQDFEADLAAVTSSDLDAAAEALEAELLREAEGSSEDDDFDDDLNGAGLNESLAEVDVSLEAWQEAWLSRVLQEENETDELQAESLAELPDVEDEDDEDYDEGEEDHPGAGARSLAEVATSGAARRKRIWTPWAKLATSTKMLGKGAHGSVQKLTFGGCGHGWSAAVKATKIDPEIQDEYKVQEKMMQTGLSTGVMQTVTSKKKQYALIEIGAGGSLKGFMKVWPNGLADTDYGRLAQEIFAQLTLVIVQMHELGIVHEDLKPGNLLINHEVCADPKRVYSAETWKSEGCALKLADFSFACPIEKGCSHKPRGTPAYMAPETWRAGPADISRDIWAVGVIFYKLLFAQYPYDTEGGLEALKANIQTGSKYRMRMAPWNWMPPFSTFTLTNRLWPFAHQVLQKTLASPPKRLPAKKLWHKRYVRKVQRDALNADFAERTNDRRHVPECVRQAPRRYRGLTVDDVDVRVEAHMFEQIL